MSRTTPVRLNVFTMPLTANFGSTMEYVLAEFGVLITTAAPKR